MSDGADPLLSAVVLLAPGRGGEAARDHFAAAGFEVAGPAAECLSITGPRSLFLDCLGPSEAPDAALRGAREGLELPVSRLPPAVAAQVRTVTFTPPPDFGPGSP